jgi:hypothetical protein
MKIRQGFVSNSSSSSFVIFKGFLNETTQNSIMDFIEDREWPPEVIDFSHPNYIFVDSVFNFKYELIELLEELEISEDHYLITVE